MQATPQRPLTPEEQAQLRQAIIQEITERPPTIGVIGVSGVGKSSTINAMFKTNLAISHVKACTKEFRDEPVQAVVQEGEAAGAQAVLRVVDAPGLGEDIGLDPSYLDMYHERLPACDVILWVLTARNRAIALDQFYLKELRPFHDRMVFAVNQVDLVEPINWNPKLNGPSSVQEANLASILEDRRDKLESVVGRPILLVPYSAGKRYNLQELFTALIEAAPRKRAWIFSSLKGFSVDDWIPVEIRAQVQAMLDQQPRSKPKRGWW